MEIEIGIGKSGRRAYGFDDIAIVPSRRTRDPEDVDISWELEGYHFDLPVLGSAMDGVISPATAIEIGRLGGVGVLNLEGLWTRYEDPDGVLDEIANLPADKATSRMQEVYQEPVKDELIGARIQEIKAAGVTCAASLTPQRVGKHVKTVLDAELDILVIQGTVVSAEHVSRSVEPLNLKKFIRDIDIPVIVGGVASYQMALHLMRTGAVGILVGVGPGHACTSRGVLGIGVPQATAIADAAGARLRHLVETDVPLHAPAGRPCLRRAEGQPPRDPGRPRPRERRDAEPLRRPAHVDGDLRVLERARVPEGRGHGGAGAADRGQGPATLPGRGDGTLSAGPAVPRLR
jgi:IMP dehydrogenase